jgi:hypothetical protein
MHFEGNSVDRHIFRFYYNEGAQPVFEALRELLITQITQRFGSLPDAAMTRVQAADADLLAHWGERLLSATSLDDLLDSKP